MEIPHFVEKPLHFMIRYGLLFLVFLSRMRERVSSMNSYQPALGKVVMLAAIRKQDDEQ